MSEEENIVDQLTDDKPASSENENISKLRTANNQLQTQEWKYTNIHNT